MNWLLGLLFLICIFSFYYLLGDFVSSLFRLKNVDSHFKVILGFISVFFLGFVAGFPAQVLKASWNAYFIAFSSILIIVVLFLIRRLNKSNIHFMSKKIIKEYLKENWFIYILVLCFIVLYSMSYLTFSYVGYDDAYYITKMVSFVGRSHFFAENYFTGFVNPHANVLSYRIFNSYELTYAYFGTLFHISIPFFAKIVMSINNFLITFFVFKIIAEKFVDKKYSQFCLIFFAIFMIPQAVVSNNNLLRIDFYDFWQFSLASFYGGNVVRNIALPVYMIEFYNLYKSFNLRSVVLIGITSIAFMSLSSIFVMWLIMCFITYALIVMFKVYRDKWKFTLFNSNKEITFVVFCLVGFYCLNTVISVVLNKLLGMLALSNNAMSDFKNNKKNDDIIKREKSLIFKLKIKFISYFILRFIFLLFFWYYLSVFSAIYKNTQIYLIKDTLLSFILSFIEPFGIYLIPGLFRIPSLSNKFNNRPILYRFSKILQNIML